MGDIIRTKSSSKTEIKFLDNSVIRLGENSRVEIKKYDIENGKRINALLYIDRGEIRAIVLKSSGKDDFRIETPNAAGTVKGTDLFVAYQGSLTSVLVVDGRVSAINRGIPDKSIEITGGNASLIPDGEVPQAPRTYVALEKDRFASATDSAPAKTMLAGRKDAKKGAQAEGYTAPGEMKATITKLSGGVRIKNRGSTVWHDAKTGEFLYTGDTIETKKNGSIEIKLDNNNIVDLKPETQLVLKKLSQDPKSGDYDNLFESDHGLIRAKVGKIKGNSKFEVKTPVAVGAVRGTIMYLRILPSLTVAYFEEGNGYLRNLISGIFKEVPMGSCSSADGQGNINDSCDAGDLKFDWNIGDQAEGYSPPGGDEGAAGGLLNFYLLANTIFSEVPITDETGFSNGGEGGTGSGGEGNSSVILSETFTGKWGDGNPTHYYRSGRFIKEAGFEKGLIGSTAQQWWNGSPFEFIASGEYSDFANAEPYLWQTPVLSFNSVTNNQKTEDGGAFFGRTVGIWNAGSMKNGKVRAIYLSPTSVQNVYNAGILSGDVSGAYYRVTNPGSTQQMGVWVADGTLKASLMAEGLIVDPSAFNDISAMLDTKTFTGLGRGTKGEGSMLGAVAGNTYRIPDQDWGIWSMSALGSAPNNNASNWRIASGGTEMKNSQVDSYFLATIVGSNWSNGELEGAVKGITLRPEGSNMAIGTITGDVVGNYVDTTWHARAVGEWVELAQLSTSQLGFTQTALADMISVPITETYSALLTQTGGIVNNGTISNMTMDISLYTGVTAATQQIWAALFNGNYTGTPDAGWSVNLGSATLTNGTWDAAENKWTATVGGNVSSNSISGAAGGTINTTTGTLTGAGAGTWSQQQPN